MHQWLKWLRFPGVLSEWRALSMQSISEDVPFLRLLGVSENKYEPTKEPLLFLHVPKTAGASLIQVIETLFDESDICPAYNPPDFELLRSAGGYRLFRGHVLARQLKFLPDSAHVATVLRHPSDFIVSMRNFVNHLTSDSYEEMQDDAGTPEVFRGNSNGIEAMLRQVLATRNERDIVDIIRSPEEKEFLLYALVFLRTFFPEAMFRRFQAEFSQVGEQLFLDEAYRREMFGGALEFLANCRTVTTIDRLEWLLYSVCWDRKCPAPPRLPEIHRYLGTQKDVRRSARLDSVVEEKWPEEIALYDHAVKRGKSLEEALTQCAGGKAHVRERLNQRFKQSYLTSTQDLPGFHLTASHFWPGWGWGLRRHEDGKCSREMDDRHSATLLARLDVRCNYLLRVDFLSAEMSAAAAVRVEANGTPLEFCSYRWSQRASLEIQYVLPGNCLEKPSGAVELVFRFPDNPHVAEFRLMGLYCQPLPWN